MIGFEKKQTDITLPGMLQQEIVNLDLQTYQSQHELYAQCLTYCRQGSESDHMAQELKVKLCQRTATYNR